MDRQGKKLQRFRSAPGREARAAVRALTGEGRLRRDLLIEYLHRIQDRYGHLAEEHLAALAHEMGLARAEVFEVASFYHHFDVVKKGETPPPALTVRVCQSISCEMAGSAELTRRLEAILGSGVRVQKVPCLGRCETAPNVFVGRRPVARATPESVQAAVRAGVTEPAIPDYVGYAAYRAAGGYRIAAELLAGTRDPEPVIQAMEHSGLRGLGGAGFPAGRKWRIVRGYPAPRMMAVNVDEGEPGTLKDRYYLERDPHRFLEGMLIAAYCVGVGEVVIYLRDEYPECRAILQRELDALRADPPCALPPIEVRRGAGAYICGEESAMLESIEGKRGMPRLRPPYIAERGLWGYPTLEHNMETLYWVRDILEQGPEHYARQGMNGRKGLRSYSVSGRVARPGVHRAPAGITLRQLIDDYCGGMLPGHELYGYFPGGASGGILPASLADVPLDFDTLQEHGCFIGSAAIIVLSDQDSARAAALNAMRFFADESCGKCTPCRVGTAKAAELMARPDWDVPLLDEMARTMMDASICGLGQAAPNPMLSVIRFFPQELD
ncbi:MAG TPA: NAD(P)H-dependent oxidoreductase subunit E [Rhodocyclaceae bacterium]|nr:NAD(P)H-dependent oxidoreductase subunit E [Rhodocyclaceae bacterium]